MKTFLAVVFVVTTIIISMYARYVISSSISKAFELEKDMSNIQSSRYCREEERDFMRNALKNHNSQGIVIGIVLLMGFIFVAVITIYENL